MAPIKSIKIRQALSHTINLGMTIASTLIMLKIAMCVTGTEAPAAFVLSGSMEPAFKRVHEREGTYDADILTKGDNNRIDDRVGNVYADGQRWLKPQHIIGRAIGYLPYVGWYILMALTVIPFPPLKSSFRNMTKKLRHRLQF